MYVLHYSPDSASLIVQLVLSEWNLPHENRLIDRDGGALNSAAYRAMQPLGLIPALETPDGPMFETAAMLLYLSDRHPGLAPAPDHPDRAAFLSWFVFVNNSLHTTVLRLFYPERMAGADHVAAVTAYAKADIARFLALLNDMVERQAPDWLSADRPTILGYYLGVLMRWLGSFGPGHALYLPSSDYPALHAILKMLQERPAALAAAKAEGLGTPIFTSSAA